MTARFSDEFSSLITAANLTSVVGSASSVTAASDQLVLLCSGTPVSGLLEARDILRDPAGNPLSLADCEAICRWDIGAAVTQMYPALMLRTSNDWLTGGLAYAPTNGYIFEIQPNDSSCDVYKFTGGSTGAVTGTHSAAKTYTGSVKVFEWARVIGNTLFHKVWMDNTNEPTNWDVTPTDSSLTSGGVQLRNHTGISPKTAKLDFLIVRDMTWTERLGRRR